MAKISAVIICKNESEHIGACLAALQEAVEDILVVDSMSTDDTVDICRQAGVRVVQTAWQGYAQTKNYANSLATYDWILSIDADEILSAELIQQIRNLQPLSGHVYSLDRINNFCGQWIKHAGWYPDWKKRLFERTTALWEGDYVHEQLKHPKNHHVTPLQGRLLHYSYSSLEDHWKRMEKYTQLAAEEMYHKKKSANWIKLWLSPIFSFLRTYIFKFGILDGKNGWIICKRNAALTHMKYKKLKAMYRQSS